jgi:hypothetical protein
MGVYVYLTYLHVVLPRHLNVRMSCQKTVPEVPLKYMLHERKCVWVPRIIPGCLHPFSRPSKHSTVMSDPYRLDSWEVDLYRRLREHHLLLARLAILNRGRNGGTHSRQGIHLLDYMPDGVDPQALAIYHNPASARSMGSAPSNIPEPSHCGNSGPRDIAWTGKNREMVRAPGTVPQPGSTRQTAPTSHHAVNQDMPLCPICLDAEVLGSIIQTTLPCGHQFHVNCLQHWFRQNRNCPICRAIVP